MNVEKVICEGCIGKDRQTYVVVSIEADGKIDEVVRLSTTEAKLVALDLLASAFQIEDDLLLWNFLLAEKLADATTAKSIMLHFSQYRARATAFNELLSALPSASQSSKQRNNESKEN